MSVGGGINWARMQGLVLNNLKKFGAPAILAARATTGSGYDPTITESYSGRIVMVASKKTVDESDGMMAGQTKAEVIMGVKASQAEPTKGDRILLKTTAVEDTKTAEGMTVAGTWYDVMAVEEVAPVGTALVWRLTVVR